MPCKFDRDEVSLLAAHALALDDYYSLYDSYLPESIMNKVQVKGINHKDIEYFIELTDAAITKQVPVYERKVMQILNDLCIAATSKFARLMSGDIDVDTAVTALCYGVLASAAGDDEYYHLYDVIGEDLLFELEDAGVLDEFYEYKDAFVELANKVLQKIEDEVLSRFHTL